MASPDLQKLQTALRNVPRKKLLIRKKWRTDNDTAITQILDHPDRFIYLQSDEWKAKKKWWWKQWYNVNAVPTRHNKSLKKSRNRKEPYCYCCKETDVPLQLHHLSYARYYGEEKFTDLIPVCSRCHLLIHKWAKLKGFVHGVKVKNLYSLTDKFINLYNNPKTRRKHHARFIEELEMIQEHFDV